MKQKGINLKTESYHISKVYDFLTEDNFLPIYFIFGTDTYEIDKITNDIISTLSEFISSDFDTEIAKLDKKDSLDSYINSALTFPFYGDKKLVVIKNLENAADKKALVEYVNSPSDFTFLVITYNEKIPNFNTEPFKTIFSNGWAFEAREMRPDELKKWVVNEVKKLKLSIDLGDAAALVEIVGENKKTLEQELKKLSSFLGEGKKITFELINTIASETKEYNIFNLLDAISSNQKERVLSIGYNLLFHGNHLLVILSTLNKYFITIMQSIELVKKNIPQKEAAAKADVSEYFYSNCLKATNFRSDKNIAKALNALIEADLEVKSTNLDQKIIFTKLVALLFS